VSAVGPPPLAAWLLRRIGGYRAESLSGDLFEEYSQGRGIGWYWRQVLRAVASSQLRFIRLHGSHLVAAITIAGGGVYFCIALIQWLSDLFWHHELATFASSMNTCILSPQVVRYMARDDLIMFWVAWTPLTALMYGIIGRLIVRIYRPHPKLVVAIFVAFILLSRLPWAYKLFLFDIDDAQLVPYPLQDLIATFICVAGALLGGTWRISAAGRSTVVTRLGAS
jgi:hypothetical protein